MTRHVKVDFDPNDGGEFAFLTIATAEARVLIKLEPTELASLACVRQLDWAQRQFIRAGTCGVGHVYWCAAEARGTVLLSIGGHDPESSDVGLVLPEGAVDQLVRLAEGRGL